MKTRDELLADAISTAEDTVLDLVSRLGSLVEQATQQDAPAHADLYEAIQGSLAAAAKQLQRAHEVMLNGDPEGGA